MNSKTFKCPFCHKKYIEKPALYTHIEKKHEEYVSDEFPPSRLYFNFINKKETGHCVICGKETEWNEVTERYNRFCCEKCKKKYVSDFQKRMIKVYGKTTKEMLSDPEMQKKMLSNRKISGKYKWSDGSTEIQYTGSYELDFLKFLDLFMHFDSSDIISPAPQVFYYNDNGNKRFYIPDFYIPSINTLVEIKDGQDNKAQYENRLERDAKKEKLKDEIMTQQKEYNFVKVVNKDYSIFLNFLMKLKNNTGDIEEKKEKFTPVIDISEAFNIGRFEIRQEILNEQQNLLQENLFITTDDYQRNLSLWKPNTNHNILFITGFSGSGKSTLAREYNEKYNAIYIELDNFEWNNRLFLDKNRKLSEGDKLIKDYFIKTYGHYISHDKWDDFSYFGKEFDKFYKYMINYCHKQKDKLYVFEGLQVYCRMGEMVIPNQEPLIIKGTSALKSNYRRNKRDGSDGNGKSPLELLEWYLKHERFVSEFKDKYDSYNI